MTSTPSENPLERDIYTPSRLNREARILLERSLPALWITGELSNFSRPSSGHWYFSLKDSDAQLRCAMFRQRNLMAQFAPKDGLHVLVRGRVSLYEPRGDYQFIADYIEEAGEGALRRQYELLKTRLAAAGLFSQDHKRSLPSLPKRIGVITSPTGAAIRDIIHILRRRFPAIPVRIYPVPVQGAHAAEQIAAAIALASARKDCDVLIVARGGGSLEDLWAFNEEIVARAIFDCRLPIISGIGHEVDFTIADLVADVRAPTPSGAAELAVPDQQQWLQTFALAEQRIWKTVLRRLTTWQERVAWMVRRLSQLHPGVQLRQQSQRVDELEQRLRRSWQVKIDSMQGKLTEQSSHLRRASPVLRLSGIRGQLQLLSSHLNSHTQRRLEAVRGKLALAARTLDAVSPLATLQRGYAIVTATDGKVLTNAKSARIDSTIRAHLASGVINARVEGHDEL